MIPNRYPIAVLISDVHYNIQTLEIADKAVNFAIDKANELDIELIVSGDLHDTKASIRGECIKVMLDTFSRCKYTPLVLRGNHDSLNEKSIEHSLEFLAGKATIVKSPCTHDRLCLELIPYHHDLVELKNYLKTIAPGSRIIMHQGLEKSYSGEYFQDKSALSHEDVKNFRVISGHYHSRQDIETGEVQYGEVGLFSYVGNPYTLNFAEANDPEKGFQILMSDGTLEFIPTNLRRHIIIETDLDKLDSGVFNIPKNGILWVKIKDDVDKLSKLTKEYVVKKLGHSNFKLDITPNEVRIQDNSLRNKPQHEVLDDLIDSATSITKETKDRIKKLWKEFV